MSCCVFMHERKIVVFIIFYVLKSQIFYCFLFSNIQSKTNIVLSNTRHPKTDNLYNLKSIKSYPLLVDWRTSKLPCGPESETVSDMLKLNERVDSPPSLFSSRQAPGFGNEGILIVWNENEFGFKYKRIVKIQRFFWYFITSKLWYKQSIYISCHDHSLWHVVYSGWQ